MRGKKSFTLAEVVITMVIVFVITLVALPRYIKSLVKNKERFMVDQLRTIYAASQLYFGSSEDYWYKDTTNIQTINDALGTRIIDVAHVSYDYLCKEDGSFCQVAALYEADNPENSFNIIIKIDEPLSDDNPWCDASGGACPTLDCDEPDGLCI